MSNIISAVLTPEEQQAVLAHFAEIRKIINININLTKQQKKNMPMLSDGRRPFAEKCLNYATNDPRIVPPYANLVELKKDLSLYDIMGPIEMEAASLSELISNIRMAAGSDAYVSSLSIYNSAKGAAKMGLPGTTAIVDDLSKLFEMPSKTVKAEAASSN